MQITGRLLVRLLTLAVLGVGLCWFQPPSAPAAITTAQRRIINLAEAAIRRANQMVDAGRLDEAFRLVKRIQEEVDKIDAVVDAQDREAARLLTPLKRRLADARGVLELEGFEFPPASNKAAPSSGSRGTNTPPPKPTSVSFKSEVAPILVQRCAGCHGGGKPKGDLSMETYALLNRGAGGSAIIDPGQSDVSQLIEVVRSGDMPKGQEKVSRAELATIETWIDQGATFDGGDPDQPLRDLIAAAGGRTTPPAPPASTVAFSTHIAPVLAENCLNCHGGQRPRNRLDMTDFQRLMRGGMTGRAIVAGNAAGSLIVQKLKGTAPDGNRMPLNAPALPAEVIADFERWIAGGARFDGPSPTAPVREVAALALAKNSTHKGLTQQRAKLADKNWDLALPDVEPIAVNSKNFLIYGSVGKTKLNEVAALAEQQQELLRDALALPADQPLVKGRMTLFVFGLRVDYSEFVFMVEKRRLDGSLRGHWRYSIVDAYGGLLPSKDEEYGLAALILQQVAGATVAARGKSVPRWFSEGVARAVTTQRYAEDTRVRQWSDQLPQLETGFEKPEDLLEGRLPPEEADILSFGLAGHLMQDKRRFRSLLTTMWDGQPFAEAFQATYGKQPVEIAKLWSQGTNSSTERSRR